MFSKLNFICFLITIHTKFIQSPRSGPDICSDPVIDSAARLSADTKFMLVFKDNYFWVLDLSANTLRPGEPMSRLVSGDVVNVNASWIAAGFDGQHPTSGQLMLLKGTRILTAELTFDGSLAVSGTNEHSLHDWWSDANDFIVNHPIEDITQLNTFGGQVVGSVDSGQSSRDILVFSTNLFAILWWSEVQKYTTKNKLEPLSHADTNELTFLVPEAREQSYWDDRPSDPVFKFIDLTALVLYPQSDDVFAFGRDKTYCKVNLKTDLICRPKDIRSLFGCDSQSMPDNITNTTSSDTPTIDSDRRTSVDEEPGKPDPTGESGSNSSPDSTKYLIVVVLALICIIVILSLIAIGIYVMKKKSSEEKSDKAQKGRPEPVDIKPIDPRYGQLDSSVNLTMKIAEPSYIALDQQQQQQQVKNSDKGVHSEVKSESDSEPKGPKTIANQPNRQTPVRPQKL